VEEKTSYYSDPKDNIAFERCIEVMSRLMLKYGPQVLEELNQEKLREIVPEIESGANTAALLARLQKYCQLMRSSGLLRDGK